jgi:hypothetical protein
VSRYKVWRHSDPWQVSLWRWQPRSQVKYFKYHPWLHGALLWGDLPHVIVTWDVTQLWMFIHVDNAKWLDLCYHYAIFWRWIKKLLGILGTDSFVELDFRGWLRVHRCDAVNLCIHPPYRSIRLGFQYLLLLQTLSDQYFCIYKMILMNYVDNIHQTQRDILR